MTKLYKTWLECYTKATIFYRDHIGMPIDKARLCAKKEAQLEFKDQGHKY